MVDPNSYRVVCVLALVVCGTGQNYELRVRSGNSAHLVAPVCTQITNNTYTVIGHYRLRCNSATVVEYERFAAADTSCRLTPVTTPLGQADIGLPPDTFLGNFTVPAVYQESNGTTAVHLDCIDLGSMALGSATISHWNNSGQCTGANRLSQVQTGVCSTFRVSYCSVREPRNCTSRLESEIFTCTTAGLEVAEYRTANCTGTISRTNVYLRGVCSPGSRSLDGMCTASTTNLVVIPSDGSVQSRSPTHVPTAPTLSPTALPTALPTPAPPSSRHNISVVYSSDFSGFSGFTPAERIAFESNVVEAFSVATLVDRRAIIEVIASNHNVLLNVKVAVRCTGWGRLHADGRPDFTSLPPLTTLTNFTYGGGFIFDAGALNSVRGTAIPNCPDQEWITQQTNSGPSQVNVIVLIVVLVALVGCVCCCCAKCYTGGCSGGESHIFMSTSVSHGTWTDHDLSREEYEASIAQGSGKQRVVGVNI